MNDLKNKKLFLLDMDGTIYLDNVLFEGVIEFLGYIKGIGGRYIFLTNNSAKSVDKYVEKLLSLGIDVNEEDFFTSVNATIMHLEGKKYRKIYAFGTESFRRQLREANFNITDKLEDDIDCLVMGYDTELTYKKLEEACILLGRGVDYIATNPDYVCPTWYGYVPDCGSVADMLYNATKRRPLVIGKPKPEMPLSAVEKTGYKKEEAVVIGDRLYTDIACGVNAGISSIFVLSGEGTVEDLEKSDVLPDYVYEDIKSILKDLKN